MAESKGKFRTGAQPSEGGNERSRGKNADDKRDRNKSLIETEGKPARDYAEAEATYSRDKDDVPE